MDYKDYLVGKSESGFWFRAKINLINILFKKNFPNTSKKLKILSIGAGTGEELSVLNKFGEVYVIDIEKKALDLIKDNLCKEKKVCDTCKLFYKNNFFDVVVAFDVLEHIEKDKVAIKEIKRVLKKQGTFIFSVPAFQFLYGPHDKALEHKRRYSKKKLISLLQVFNKTSLYYWNFFMFPYSLTRLLKKNSPPKVEEGKVPFILDKFCFGLLKIENFLIQNKIKLPFGVSLFGISKK